MDTGEANDGFSSGDDVLQLLDTLAGSGSDEEDDIQIEGKQEEIDTDVLQSDAIQSEQTEQTELKKCAKTKTDIPVPIWGRVDKLEREFEGYDDVNSKIHYDFTYTFKFCFVTHIFVLF